MEEKNNNFSVDKEELKSETKETISQVKETIKNVNIKEESVATKNFVVEIFKEPINKLKEIIEDNSGKFLKFAILILAVYVLVEGVDTIITTSSYGSWAKTGYKVKLIIKDMIYPILRVLIPAVVILIFNKENKKSLITIISAVVTAKIPVIAGSVISLINQTKLDDITYITSPVVTVCDALSLILMFFVVKHIFKEEDESKALKKFALVWLITSIVFSVINLLVNKVIFK